VARTFDGLELKATLLFRLAIKDERAVNMYLTTERAQLDGLMIFIAVAEQRGFRAAAVLSRQPGIARGRCVFAARP
jgi:hypothetical protein